MDSSNFKLGLSSILIAFLIFDNRKNRLIKPSVENTVKIPRSFIFKESRLKRNIQQFLSDTM